MDVACFTSRHCRLISLTTLASIACGFAPRTASAHVKWFADFDYATPPRSIAETATPTFCAMFVLSLVVLMVLVWLDRIVATMPAANRLNDWFDARSGYSLLVMRVATFATLLVAWQLGTLFAPELATNNLW